MEHIWQIRGGASVALGAKSRLMGIINATPDSFSDGGECATVPAALARARQMAQEGADILDIGGESTRPNAAPVGAAEEQKRVLPVIRALAGQGLGLPLSVDTYKAETAAAALAAGAQIVNDVCGLQKEPAMAELIAATGAGIVIMHTGRGRKKHSSPLEDQKRFFAKSLEIAAKAGIKPQQIVLDPGFGFAKTEQESLILLRHAAELRQYGLPLLAGLSRKGFLGRISGQSAPQTCDIATAAGSAILRLAGFSLFRAHNIAVNRQALALADAVCAAEEPEPAGKGRAGNGAKTGGL